MVNFVVEDLIDFSCAFVGHFGFDMHFEQVIDGGFKLGLYEPELLIDLVPEYFSKHTNIVVFSRVCLNSRNDAAGCLNRKILKIKHKILL